MSSERNRYEHLYDEASIEYAESCRRHNWYAVRSWKKRLEWLDRMLARNLEVK